MSKRLIPAFYTMNFDASLSCKNGITGRQIDCSKIRFLEQGVKILLPKDEKAYVVAEDYDGKARVVLFNDTAKSKRGEYVLGDLAEFVQ